MHRKILTYHQGHGLELLSKMCVTYAYKNPKIFLETYSVIALSSPQHLKIFGIDKMVTFYPRWQLPNSVKRIKMLHFILKAAKYLKYQVTSDYLKVSLLACFLITTIH